MKTRHTGFSTIELIVTVALIAIAATMAAPSMTKLDRSSRLTAATNEFVTALRFARIEALKRGVNVEIVSNNGTDWTDGWVVQTAQDDTVLRVHSGIKGDLKLKAGHDTYTFNSLGNLSGIPSSTMEVCDKRHPGAGRQLTLTAVGRVAIDSNYSSCP